MYLLHFAPAPRFAVQARAGNEGSRRIHNYGESRLVLVMSSFKNINLQLAQSFLRIRMKAEITFLMHEF